MRCFRRGRPGGGTLVGAETRHPTFLGDVRKLVKIPKGMGFPVDAVRLENQRVWFLWLHKGELKHYNRGLTGGVLIHFGIPG
jgi:hypothetical protein